MFIHDDHEFKFRDDLPFSESDFLQFAGVSDGKNVIVDVISRPPYSVTVILMEVCPLLLT